MDLEGTLLTELSDYEPRLQHLASFRDLVYTRKTDQEARDLVDALCYRFLLEDMEPILPEDESEYEKAVAALPMIGKLFAKMRALGYGQRENELIFCIISWAGAQMYSRWQQAPWNTAVTIIRNWES